MSIALRLIACRLSLVLLLLATLAFAAPAFESHACAADVSEATTAIDVSGDAEPACGDCPDCGPACADGCCHASHLAMIGPVGVGRWTVDFRRSAAWTQATAPPATRPSGPERPPRS